MSIKILLAGPGTGKTAKISREFIKQRENTKKILILSFTNATINDLLTFFEENKIEINGDNCMTLSKFSLRINPSKDLHVFNDREKNIIEKYAKELGIDFEVICKLLGCITFEQMITKCNDYIETNPVYIKEQLSNYDLLIIDEYQDFNEEERKLLKKISDVIGDTIILGDDDQSIYGFKNADPDGIISLYNDKTVEKIEHDNICYRCPPDVIKACVNLIKNNKNRIDKNWKTSKTTNGLFVIQMRTTQEAGEYITSFVKKHGLNELSHGLMVLAPFRFIGEELSSFFEENGVPYLNWYTNDTSDSLLKKIWELRTIFGAHKLLNLLLLSNSKMSSLSRTNKSKFISSVKEIFNSDAENMKDISTAFKNIIDNQVVIDSLSKAVSVDDYIGYYPEDKKLISLFAVGHKKEVQHNLEKLEILLNPPQVFDKNKVNILSIHKSKGLQANHVFVLGLVEGFLPNETKGIETIEAQRRSLFVAMSRTRDSLHLLSTIYSESKHVFRYGDKCKFSFDPKTKKYKGASSSFLSEIR